jgi:hypothetical protein
LSASQTTDPKTPVDLISIHHDDPVLSHVHQSLFWVSPFFQTFLHF